MSDNNGNGFSNRVKAILPIVTIASLTAMEMVALFCGINGTLFSTVMALVAGVGGLSSGYIFGSKPQPVQTPKVELVIKEEDEEGE